MYNRDMKTSILSILLAVLSISTSFAGQIEPSSRAAALMNLRAAYADLAQAQRQVVFRKSLERAACEQIGKLKELYPSKELITQDGSGNTIKTLQFDNASINAIQSECDVSQKWQRISTILALHDEMVRLLDQEIASLKR